MTSKIAILASCAFLTSVAFAADIYRWVDENGHTHISDTVPARYRSIATKVDTRPSELTESRRLEAEARAAKDKQNAAAIAADKPATSDSKKKREKTSPASSSSDADCAKLVKAYRESQECFAPYMRQSGGTRVDAYRNCTEVADPSDQCGLPSN